MQNYFTLFGLKESFLIDANTLRAGYFELQKQHHPDVAVSALNTNLTISNINEAYKCLSDDYSRSAYLVKMWLGYDINSDSTIVLDQDILEQIMDINQHTEESGDTATAEAEILKLIKDISMILVNKETAIRLKHEAVKAMLKLRYLTKILSTVD